MRKISTVALLVLVFISGYGVFFVLPSLYEKYLYVEVMQACTQQRLYMIEEATLAFNNVKDQATPEERDLIAQSLDESTAYFHSPEFYQKCYEQTLKEWSLSAY